MTNAEWRILIGIPILVSANIPWEIFGPMVLIGLGIVVLVKTFYLKDEAQ